MWPNLPIPDGVNDLSRFKEYDFIDAQEPFQHRYYVSYSYIKPEEFPEDVFVNGVCKSCFGKDHIARQCYDRALSRLKELGLPETKVNDYKFKIEEELRCVYDQRDYWRNRSELGEIEIDRLLKKLADVKLEGQREANFQAGLAQFYIKEFNKVQLENLSFFARKKWDKDSQTENFDLGVRGIDSDSTKFSEIDINRVDLEKSELIEENSQLKLALEDKNLEITDLKTQIAEIKKQLQVANLEELENPVPILTTLVLDGMTKAMEQLRLLK